MPKLITSALLLLFLPLCGSVARTAAQTEETIDVRTRVVFVDALVRDKRTGAAVADLARENFEILDEGRARPLSYFSREGEGDRKPLALVLVLDAARYGASRFLKRADIIERMTKELARLPSRDEIAVFVCGTSFVKSGWLTSFTSDRAQTAAALARVPSMIEEDRRLAEEAEERGGNGRLPTAVRDGRSDPPKNAGGADAAGADAHGEIASRTETFEDNRFITRTVYKNGDTITQTIYWNGRRRVVKTSRDGTETEVIDEYAMPLKRATAEAVRLAADERPASQAAVVWVSDGIDFVYKAEQREAAESLLRQGVIFNALVADMLFGFKLFKPVLVPLGNAVGMSTYGTAARLARDTGGVTVRVRRPDDYARGLGKIIGDLASRYSLGFKLDEAEAADGRLRRLEVRVNVRDAKGKRRKLEVAARRGYFVQAESRTPPATESDSRSVTALP